MSFAPAAKTIVLDANILIRAVLGRRVLNLLERYSNRVRFVAPEQAFTDAHLHVPRILSQRGVSDEAVALFVETLDRLGALVVALSHESFADLEAEARSRLKRRDEADWPYLALALRLECPIWTEDTDFFGSGVATWTTDRVELYLAG